MQVSFKKNNFLNFFHYYFIFIKLCQYPVYVSNFIVISAFWEKLSAIEKPDLAIGNVLVERTLTTTDNILFDGSGHIPSLTETPKEANG